MNQIEVRAIILENVSILRACGFFSQYSDWSDQKIADWVYNQSKQLHDRWQEEEEEFLPTKEDFTVSAVARWDDQKSLDFFDIAIMDLPFTYRDLLIQLSQLSQSVFCPTAIEEKWINSKQGRFMETQIQVSFLHKNNRYEFTPQSMRGYDLITTTTTINQAIQGTGYEFTADETTIFWLTKQEKAILDQKGIKLTD